MNCVIKVNSYVMFIKKEEGDDEDREGRNEIIINQFFGMID